MASLRPVFLLPLLILFFTDVGEGGPAEDRLISTLLKGYNPLARPVEDSSTPVDVYFGIGLIQILQIVEVEQTVKTNVWLRFYWYDPRLAWNIDEYEGVANIRLPFDAVWNPEVVLFNNANGVYEVNFKSNAVIYPDGGVLWVPPALFVSSCSIDVLYFPFDEQRCEMVFGSWTYNSDQVKFYWYDGGPGNPYAVMGDYVRSGSWDVTMVPGVIKTDLKTKVTNCVFYLHMRRKTLFFIINLIVPCVVIAILCWFVFLLPANSGEKVGYAITLLLGLMVFLLLLFTVLPATSESVPLMAKFLLFIYVANVVTIVLCVWIIGYSFRLPSTHFMSDGVRALFLNLLPKLIGMKRPDPEPYIHEPRFKLEESIRIEETRATANQSMTQSHNSLDGQPGFSSRSDFRNILHRKAANASPSGNSLTGTPASSMTTSAMVEPFSQDIITAAKDARYLAERASAENEDGQVAADWKYIGLVLDRLLFWVAGSVIIGGTCYFVMGAPNSFGGVDQVDLLENWDAIHCKTFWSGQYQLYSHTTADAVTKDTMKNLCCPIFFSAKYAEKSSKYSNETATPKLLDQMTDFCAESTARKKRSVEEIQSETDDSLKTATRASGQIKIKNRKPVDQVTAQPNTEGVNWEEKFREKGLDLEEESKAALEMNLAMMRTGERDFRKVDELHRKPPVGGRRFNIPVKLG